MEFLNFLKSKAFIGSVIAAIILVIALGFGMLRYLDTSTKHSQRIVVPNLKTLSMARAKLQLEQKTLRAAVEESANFNPKFPPLTVIDQKPQAGDFVKENRKIYLVVNPKDYRKVKLPDVIQKTKRQARPTLQSVGFRVGKTIYRPDIARNVVLEMRHDGKVVRPGDLVRKTSIIDLVVGDGTR